MIARDFGMTALPDRANVFKTKSKNAQEAHEAIRPTSALRTPASVARHLSDDERRLGHFKLDGLGAPELEDETFEPLPSFEAGAPRDDDVLLMAV